MKFIVFEGLDGAGKSTLIAGLEAAIRTKGGDVTLTREPGGTPLGEAIRELLLRLGPDAPVPRAELLLYEASRAQHVEKLIQPKLNLGHWVICDRFSASSVAFQVGGRGLPFESVDWLNDYATQGLEPDLYVLLDLPTAEAKKRMADRALDRFESEEREFHERVRKSYLDLAKAKKGKWLILDATKKKEALMEDLLSHLRGKKWL